jgi:hypothetical protein
VVTFLPTFILTQIAECRPAFGHVPNKATMDGVNGDLVIDVGVMGFPENSPTL